MAKKVRSQIKMALRFFSRLCVCVGVFLDDFGLVSAEQRERK